MKTTLAARIVSATRLLSVPTLWAFLGRICLVDSLDGDSSEPGFVLDHPSKLAIGPLMEALVHSLSVVHPITDAANITDRNRRDTLLKKHLHDLSAQFVKEVRDLVVDVLKLFASGLDELLPAIRSMLFAVYFRIEFGLETVLVVSESPKLPAVNCERIVACEDSGEVLLSEIDSGHLVSGGSVNGFCVVLRSDDKAIGTLPNLDGSRFLIDRPVD
jgi:hypothetical protein